MVWSILESTVNKALHYSTPLGYMWMFLLFTFRMFITAVVGSAVYGDEVVSYILKITEIMEEIFFKNPI